MKTTYEHFEEEFLKYNIEAWLLFENVVISLVDCPKKGWEASAVYIRDARLTNDAFDAFINRITGNDLLFEHVYPSRKELLNDFRYKGMSLKEMWKEIELLNEF